MRCRDKTSVFSSVGSVGIQATGLPMPATGHAVSRGAGFRPEWVGTLLGQGAEREHNCSRHIHVNKPHSGAHGHLAFGLREPKRQYQIHVHTFRAHM